MCRRRHWVQQKVNKLISEAREPGCRGNVVTKSDEAFALLLYENYIDTWKSPLLLLMMLEILIQVSRKDKERRRQNLYNKEHAQGKKWAL